MRALELVHAHPVQLLAGLDVDVHGQQGQVVHAAVQLRQLGVEALLGDGLGEACPHDLLEEKDKRKGLGGREVLHGPYPYQRIEAGADRLGVLSYNFV